MERKSAGEVLQDRPIKTKTGLGWLSIRPQKYSVLFLNRRPRRAYTLATRNRCVSGLLFRAAEINDAPNNNGKSVLSLLNACCLSRDAVISDRHKFTQTAIDHVSSTLTELLKGPTANIIAMMNELHADHPNNFQQERFEMRWNFPPRAWVVLVVRGHSLYGD
jgi:hypothetical protein